MSEDPAPLPTSLPPVRFATLPTPPPPPDRCPYCGMPIEIGAPVCRACGARLAPDPPPATPIADAAWEPTDCPRCGRPLDSVVVVTELRSGFPVVVDLEFAAPPEPGGTRITGETTPLLSRRSMWRPAP